MSAALDEYEKYEEVKNYEVRWLLSTVLNRSEKENDRFKGPDSQLKEWMLTWPCQDPTNFLQPWGWVSQEPNSY